MVFGAFLYILGCLCHPLWWGLLLYRCCPVSFNVSRGVVQTRNNNTGVILNTKDATHTDHCGSRRWQGGKNRRRHKCSFTADTEVNQMLLHSLVNEQQSKQTSETCSSFPGSPSRILTFDSCTFSTSISTPPIWYRGPRPKAHWYMCTDGNHDSMF